MKQAFWKIRKPEAKQEKGKSGNTIAWLLHAQRKWAKWMQQQTERLSVKGKLALLIIFCVSAVSGSIALIYRGIAGSNPTAYQVSRIQVPVLPEQQEPGPIDSGSMQRIQRFRDYMDSLSKNQYGKKIYDSILLVRPGLMDSIAAIERFNREQLKN
jgi:hypothetical protein